MVESKTPERLVATTQGMVPESKVKANPTAYGFGPGFKTYEEQQAQKREAAQARPVSTEGQTVKVGTVSGPTGVAGLGGYTQEISGEKGTAVSTSYTQPAAPPQTQQVQTEARSLYLGGIPRAEMVPERPTIDPGLQPVLDAQRKAAEESATRGTFRAQTQEEKVAVGFLPWREGQSLAEREVAIPVPGFGGRQDVPLMFQPQATRVVVKTGDIAEATAMGIGFGIAVSAVPAVAGSPLTAQVGKTLAGYTAARALVEPSPQTVVPAIGTAISFGAFKLAEPTIRESMIRSSQTRVATRAEVMTARQEEVEFAGFTAKRTEITGTGRTGIIGEVGSQRITEEAAFSFSSVGFDKPILRFTVTEPGQQIRVNLFKDVTQTAGTIKTTIRTPEGAPIRTLPEVLYGATAVTQPTVFPEVSYSASLSRIGGGRSLGFALSERTATITQGDVRATYFVSAGKFAPEEGSTALAQFRGKTVIYETLGEPGQRGFGAAQPSRGGTFTFQGKELPGPSMTQIRQAVSMGESKAVNQFSKTLTASAAEQARLLIAGTAVSGFSASLGMRTQTRQVPPMGIDRQRITEIDFSQRLLNLPKIEPETLRVTYGRSVRQETPIGIARENLQRTQVTPPAFPREDMRTQPVQIIAPVQEQRIITQTPQIVYPPVSSPPAFPPTRFPPTWFPGIGGFPGVRFDVEPRILTGLGGQIGRAGYTPTVTGLFSGRTIGAKEAKGLYSGAELFRLPIGPQPRRRRKKRK